MGNVDVDNCPLRNHVVFTWHGSSNRWVQRERFGDPCEALERYKDWQGRVVIIDIVSGAMIADRGKFCSRVRPLGIKYLPPIERYQQLT